MLIIARFWEKKRVSVMEIARNVKLWMYVLPSDFYELILLQPQKIISSKISHSERCVRFTTRNSPLFNQCVRELSQFSPASALFDVASRDLKNCKKYWATFYCCSICMGVQLDLLNKENMTEKIQSK